MLLSKKKWSVGLCALLSLVMAVQPVITGYAASSPGAYDTANVKYLYEKDDETGEYYRTGVKSLYIAPNTYYDTTIYKPADWSTVWKDIGKKSSEDQQRADEVIALIDTLPAIVDITLADKVRVESVRSVYNKLENQQLNLVTNFDTLDKA